MAPEGQTAMVKWDEELIGEMIDDYVNEQAWRLNQIAQQNSGGEFPITISFSSPDQDNASIIFGPEGMIREYGTGSVEPRPWALPSLMEM